MIRLLFFLVVSIPVLGQPFNSAEIARWKKIADGITITRDIWGVPHIYGKTDAEAVFGMLYAQCEDDFARVERNYITATARMAEVEGERFIFNDLRMRLFLDTTRAIAIYRDAPPWMKKICTAFADGVNFYLYTHPTVKPKLLTRFQPWMPLLFSEGSIGGDIEKISLKELKAFYGEAADNIKQDPKNDGPEPEPEPKGSNGFAIGPSRSTSGNALLLINPHTSFYFRSELQVTSDEGLNAYGAVTWGQFFVYQGFNEHCGWMHTTSQADVMDEYKETINKENNSFTYLYGSENRRVTIGKIVIRYKSGSKLSTKEFTTYSTHHGPVVAVRDGKWITVKMMNEPLKALTQSFQRTRARNFSEFNQSMEMYTNSSNNTVYADYMKNIAYWHGNFIPRRDTQFDWSLPVDGSNPQTEWKGLHTLDEIVHIYNPASGWIQNCNSTPFTVAGSSSPERAFPPYMAPDVENARGIHAVKVLKDERNFTLDKLIWAAYDSYLPGFENLVPAYIKAFKAEAAANDTLRSKYSVVMEELINWDLRFSTSSVPTTLAIYWSQELRDLVDVRIPSRSDQLSIIRFLETKTSNQEKMVAMARAVAKLKNDFGTWKQPWGEVNRFQRLTGNIDPIFDDSKPSIAVPFTSSFWGSLAAFGSRWYPGTKKAYGYVGNSFVAVVEFGPRVTAKSIVTGGASSDPSSPHFTDQAAMYAEGEFKDVLFYPDDLAKYVEKKYKPGQ